MNFPKKFPQKAKQQPDFPKTAAEKAKKKEKNAKDVWTGQGKKQNCAAKKTREKEDPKLSVAHIEGEEQKRRRQDEAEEGVGEVGQPGAEDPRCPQYRPEQGDPAAEGDGEKKLPQLGKDRKIHRSRRARKPPSFRGSS